MKLLVSVIDKTEAFDSIVGGADVIDVKNPKEGSLGANFPRVIKQIKNIMPNNLELSGTIGDLPNLPGTASLAALGAIVSGVDFVKVGLFGVKHSREAIMLMSEVVKVVKDFDSNLKTIACGYADFRYVGCVNPLKLPYIANEAKANGVLIDVKIKNQTSYLFNFLSDKELKQFINQAHSYNLLTALAGSLQIKDILRLHNLQTDIIGVRGAVCTNNDRRYGKLERNKVAKFAKILQNYN